MGLDSALNERLDDAQAHQFARFAEASLTVVDAEGFARLINDHVAGLLPHGMLLAVVGQLSFEHLRIRQFVGVNYPQAVIQQIPTELNIKERPAIERWLRLRRPVVIHPEVDRGWVSPRELFEMETLGLGRIGLHGMADLSVHMATFFSFARVAEDMPTARVERLLALICPLLHGALCQVRDAHQPLSDVGNSLTQIESELLTWLAAGRSNQEMAMLRGRSPATIRNQLEKLYAKLGVSSRTEAVTWALTRPARGVEFA